MPVKQQTILWERFFDNDAANETIMSVLLHYRHFHRLHSLLKSSQWWTSEQLLEYQNERLRKLIIHAYENVPFYRCSFDTIGLQPSDICSVNDLHKLPFVTKELARNNIDDLRARNYPRHRFESMSTGGSTGDPLTFFIEKGKTAASHFAFYSMTLERALCRLTHRYLFIVQSNEFWKKQAFGRILRLSPYSLREENVQILFEKIRRVNPKYIIGFPSAISLLGHLIIKKGDNLFSELRGILCSGETLYEWQRKFLENVYRCKVFSFYNQSEQVVFAATCECSDSYHVFPEYGVTELIDEDGQLITQEGKKGEIVGTGFTNDIFPFIRYRTGDIGVYTNHHCSCCGRQYPLLKKIEGRTQEFIINKTGNALPMTGMYAIVPSSSNLVKEYQFFQQGPGELILKIVRCKGFTDSDEQLIVQRLTKTLGSGFHITVKYVDAVKRTPGGKVQFLVKSIE
ncbi:MAG TPA: phenylacetate--CoA ligase family protein [Thermoplasmata archaeon]|jgi:phenylacetate-CoA ligase|nr:MAG TPA: phenylacetate--CoA ligase family protein [Thermoplasmata archaeon]